MEAPLPSISPVLCSSVVHTTFPLSVHLALPKSLPSGKVRNYIEFSKDGAAGFNIYVQEGAILNEQHRKAYLAERPGDDKAAKDAKLNPRNEDEANRLRNFMCANFFDVRTLAP